MTCSYTLKGISHDCNVNLSGVKRLLVTDWNNITAKPTVSVIEDASLGSYKMITNIAMAEDTKFYEYIPAKNTGSLTKTLTKDETTGVKYYTNEAVANFNRMSPEKSDELSQLDGAQLAAIVEDMNGHFWYLGYDNYAQASAITGQTGASMDDGNFYTLTITDYSGRLPYDVSAGIISGLLD